MITKQDVNDYVVRQYGRVTQVDVQRPYVIVQMECRYMGVTYDAIGIAKYNPNDAKVGLPWNKKLGIAKATGRATSRLIALILEAALRPPREVEATNNPISVNLIYVDHHGQERPL